MSKVFRLVLLDSEAKRLELISKGDPTGFIKKYILSLSNKDIILKEDAKEFIDGYLSHDGKCNYIPLKDLYEEYSEFSSYPLGKTKFVRVLRESGFVVRNIHGNKRAVINIKSSWLG